jgi:predicted alpha/beta superfamily hydrolase
MNIMTRFKKLYSSALCIFLFSSNIYADVPEITKKFELENTQIISIKSLSGDSHELVVSLPGSYYGSSNKRYPVLYYTDAYWDAPLLNSIYLDLNFDRDIPEFILVGLSYPPTPDNYSEVRRRDLPPSKDANISQTSGGGEAFLKFIKETVVPRIENEYRVESKSRAIAGWSNGGLFVLYAMYKDPDFFSCYVAISPSVTWDNGFINRLDDEYFKFHKELRAKLFISYAENESKLFSVAVEDFQKKIEARKYKGLYLRNIMVEDRKHAGAKSIGYTQGLAWIWNDAELK